MVDAKISPAIQSLMVQEKFENVFGCVLLCCPFKASVKDNYGDYLHHVMSDSEALAEMFW